MKKQRITLILASLLLAINVQCSTPSKQETPNIVLFFIDDLGWTDLECYGSSFYKTPAINELATNGVKFTNAYSACAVCSPTRAALMTGKYPARINLTDWITGHPKPWAKLKVPDWTMYLDHKEESIAEILKKQGYSTWHVGKWHLGDEEEYWPEHHGFDTNIAGNFKGAPKKNKQGCNGYFSPYCLPRIEDGPEGEYLTDRLTNDAVQLIENRNDNPFFLYLSHYAVHTPIQAKKEVIEKYKQMVDTNSRQKNVTYAAMIESMDESIQKVMTKLEEEKLLENTLVIFASDNGALEHISGCDPLKHGKGWAYEGGTRTPMIIYWKNKFEGNKIIDEPVITMDIFSTILETVGVNQSAEIDGNSLYPVILDDKEYKRPLFWHYPHYHKDKQYGSVRYGDWKLIEYFEDDHFELYNLKDDLGESKNIAKEHPEKLAELQKLMNDWRKEVGAQMPAPNPDYDPAKANKSGKYMGRD